MAAIEVTLAVKACDCGIAMTMITIMMIVMMLLLMMMVTVVMMMIS